MDAHSTDNGGNRPAGLLGIVYVGILATLVGGCNNWSYEQVRLGMTQQECTRTFAEDTVRRTELGYCLLQEDSRGNVAALVVLMTRDGLVSGKLQARLQRRNVGLTNPWAYELRGELDPALAGLGATGPIDMLRAILDDLASFQGVRSAQGAHEWLAAGLVRLLERWPHIEGAARLYPHLAEELERVPAGGYTHLRINPQGHYLFEYGLEPRR
ncbi:MAG: hypothetical protein ABIG44_11275 [Planctomycetota bacterium]